MLLISLFNHTYSQGVCLWGNENLNNSFINGQFTNAGTYDSRPYYLKTFPGCGHNIYLWYWSPGTVWVITQTTPAPSPPLAFASCDTSSTDLQTDCGIEMWSILGSIDNNVYSTYNACPEWVCDMVRTTTIGNGCNQDFSVQVDTNVWRNTASTKYWWFDYSVFAWRCTNTYCVGCPSCANYAITVAGWTANFEGNSTSLDFEYPPTAPTIHNVECIDAPTLNPTSGPTNQPTLAPTNQPTIPTTNIPTTTMPTTAAPTSASPTTSIPTTSIPTTIEPTTSEPTTISPTSGVGTQRTILGTWLDDYDNNSPLPGWEFSDPKNTYSGIEPITNGNIKYHGPFEAINDGFSSGDDLYTIQQQFYCWKRSQVSVTFKIYTCGTEPTDDVTLTLQGNSYQNTLGPISSSSYTDATLDAALTQGACTTGWFERGPYGPYIIADVDINTLFTVTFVSKLGTPPEAIALSNMSVTCNADPFTTTINPTTSIPTTNIPTTTSQPTTSQPTTTEPTTFTPTTLSPTAPTTPRPTTSLPTTGQPTTFMPTTFMPTTSQPTAPTTSIPTTIEPTTSIPTTSIPTTITTFGENGDESNVTDTKSDSIIIIIVIVVLVVIMLVVVILLFYCKPWRKRINKEKLEMNIKNVEFGNVIPNKTTVGDDDIVAAINTTDMGLIKKSDDDIITQINQTDIGDNERSDEDLIPVVNETDIGVDNSDIIKAVNNTHMGNIPPKVNKINSISNDDDLDEVKNNNEEEDLIQTINYTAGANEFVIDGDSENEEIIVPGMEVNVIGESEGVNYKLDEDGAKEVRLWLDSIGYSMYYDVLVQNGFDSMECIQEITDIKHLNDIGITLKGHQLKFMKHIKMSKTDH